MNQEVLEIEYEVDYNQFRKVWVSYFKKGLPNILAFWGVAALFSLFVVFFFGEAFIGLLLAGIFVSIPLLTLYFNYQNFTKTARQTYREMSDEERTVRIKFINGADGFDSRNGKNLSHTAWESVKGVQEFDEYFVFNRLGSYFYIPKSAFRDNSEVGFLRYLITTNVEKNVKLLD
jgi:hypothetical protein